MKRYATTLAGAIITAVCSSPALADNRHSYHEEARVLHSTPVYRRVEYSEPVRRCWNEEVRVERRGRSHTPKILGALIGGAIGNELGHHKSNQRVGAVAGAILGGSVASDLSRRARQHDRGDYRTVERCSTEHRYDSREELSGYDVTYEYDGREYRTRLPYDPGRTLQVRVSVDPLR